MTDRLLRYRRFWTVFVALLALDQATKLAVMKLMPETGWSHPGIVVIPGFFRIIHVNNTGAAFSLFNGQQGCLIILAIAALWAMYRWRHTIGLRKPFVQAALGAFAGGALGNVVDRILYFHVVDFLAFRIPVIDYPWPAFNVADIGITVGAALYCWYGFTEKPEKPTPSAATPAK